MFLRIEIVILNAVKSGMIPNLVMTLTKHASLAQDVLDSDISFRAVEFLSRCKRDLEALSELEQRGKLPEAVAACERTDELLKAIPPPLEHSKIMADFKVCTDHILCDQLYSMV